MMVERECAAVVGGDDHVGAAARPVPLQNVEELPHRLVCPSQRGEIAVVVAPVRVLVGVAEAEEEDVRALLLVVGERCFGREAIRPVLSLAGPGIDHLVPVATAGHGKGARARGRLEVDPLPGRERGDLRPRGARLVEEGRKRGPSALVVGAAWRPSAEDLLVAGLRDVVRSARSDRPSPGRADERAGPHSERMQIRRDRGRIDRWLVGERAIRPAEHLLPADPIDRDDHDRPVDPASAVYLTGLEERRRMPRLGFMELHRTAPIGAAGREKRKRGEGRPRNVRPCAARPVHALMVRGHCCVLVKLLRSPSVLCSSNESTRCKRRSLRIDLSRASEHDGEAAWTRGESVARSETTRRQRPQTAGHVVAELPRLRSSPSTDSTVLHVKVAGRDAPGERVVVGDEDDAARVRRERALQPLDRR